MRKNELKLGVILSYVQMAVTNAISIIYTPLMIRLLGKSEYGLLSLTSSVISYLGILSFGLTGSYTYFYFKTKKKQEEKGVERLNGTFFTIFAVISLVSFLCGLVMTFNVKLLFADGLTSSELDKAKILMLLMAVSLAVTFLTTVFVAYINTNERFVFIRILNIIVSLTGPMVNLPLMFMGYRSIPVTITTVTVNILQSVVIVYYCVKKMNMRFSFSNIQIATIKGMFTFSFFIFLNQIVDEVNWNVDRFIIGRFFGTSHVAVYSVGSSINKYYIVLSTAISGVFAPRINRIVQNGKDNNSLNDLMIRIGRIQFMLLSLVLTGFVFLGKYFILGYYAGAGYEDAYIVALVLMIPTTVPLIQNVGIEIQRAKNKHQFRSIVYVGIAIFNVIISIPLCKRFGIIGSAIGTCACVSIGNIAVMNWFYHCRLGLDMKAFWKNIVKLLPSEIIPVFIGTVAWRWIGVDSLLEFLVFGIVYVTLFSLCLWLFGMNDYEKNLVKAPVNRVINKVKSN